MPDVPFADVALAARLEHVAAEDLATFAEAAQLLDAGSLAQVMRVAGGIALFAGAGSPINQAAGLGFDGEVSRADVDALEEFFRAHGARPVVLASPLARPSLFHALSARGFRISAFENALVRALRAEPVPAPDPRVEVREACTPTQRAAYARTIVEGFAPVGRRPSAEEEQLGRMVVARPRATLLLAYVDGEVAGTGELTMRDGLAWLNGDTTLPPFRRRGVQQALQRARLTLAEEAGCDLAVTDATPGSASQRNMERLGFRVAYTRVELTRGA